jgi:hypothetical protein
MIGYVVRMHQGRIFKKVFGSKPEGSRSGRPRLRCLEDVEKYLREMKVKRLRQKTVDREELGVCNYGGQRCQRAEEARNK